MKVIAMYLPQFHRVKENDVWWGEGFTEWTTVKQAKPLFEGHVQPRVPQNNNYYNLLDKKTMQWQASLMKKYGIDGMCMYHYWFKDGRQILEKPVENLLKWKDIDMPFCFCWANETWARSWSGLQNINVWADNCEPQKKTGKKVLLEQRYGNKEQWKTHFEYLLPFFKDERYIKIDEKPVFVFYRAKLIPCFENMVDEWQGLALEAGLKGIYVIAHDCKQSSKKCLDATLLHNPPNVFTTEERSEIINEKYDENYILDYDYIWKKILDRPVSKGTIIGGFVDYDDTPRREKNGSACVGGAVDKFKQYFTELLAKNACLGNEFVFLNAWNEWGEGMYLEPDEINGKRYLESIQYAKDNYRMYIKKYERINVKPEKNIILKISNNRSLHYSKILDDWMYLMENHISIEAYLYERGYRDIALYGYGILGKHFEKQITGNLINLKCVIDKNKENIISKLPVYGLKEEVPDVQAIVVSPTFSYGEIYTFLRQKNIGDIVSLEHIIEECLSKIEE